MYKENNKIENSNMKNKKHILIDFFSIILNFIIVYIIASNSWISLQPPIKLDIVELPSYNKSILQEIVDYCVYMFEVRKAGITTIVAFITVVLTFLINKTFIKKDTKVYKYILIFFLISIVNLFIYQIRAGVAV